MNKTILLLILSIILFSTGNASADTPVGGIISTNTTWDFARHPFIVTSNVTVQGSAAPILTIEPGVEVRFNSGTQLIIGSNSSSQPGALMAQGTVTQPILFTSNEAVHTPGFWNGILFQNYALDTSIMDYCTVEYAGGGGFNIHFSSASPMLRNSIVRESSQWGIHLTSSNAVIEDTAIYNVTFNGVYIVSGANNPLLRRLTLTGSGGRGFLSATTSTVGGELTNSTLEKGLYFTATSTMQITGNTLLLDNGFPMRIGANSVGMLLSNNTFQGVTPGTTTLEVIGQIITTSATWANNGIICIIMGTTSVYGTTSPILTLSPGIELRFNSATQLIIGSNSSSQPGALMAQGTVTQPILFTSNEAVHTPGFWNGILFQNYAQDTSLMDYCTVEYAGGAGYNIYFNLASPTLRHATIREGSNHGIQLTTSNATVEDTAITNIVFNGIRIASGINAPILRRLTITGTINRGIRSITTGVVGGELSDSYVINGIYFDAVSTMQITGNTFTNYNAVPTRIGANSVGMFLNNNTFQDVVPGTSILEVLGEILTTSASWPNNGMLYIILGTTSVYGTSSPVLTLSPGLELRFNSATQLIIGHSTTSTQIGGLIAQGTPTQPILFTSNEAVHTPGFWNGILFQNYALDTSIMDYCTVEYAGGGGFNIYFSSASPTLRNSIVRESSQMGIRLTTSNVTIEDTTITNVNPNGLYIVSGINNPILRRLNISGSVGRGFLSATASTVGGELSASTLEKGLYFTATSTMQITGNTLLLDNGFPMRIGANSVGMLLNNNTLQGITPGTTTLEILGEILTTSASWPNNGMIYIILGITSVYGTSSPVLTLSPGLELRFNAATQLIIGHSTTSTQIGGLIAQGTPTQPILFTSNEAVHTPGFWNGILFQNYALDTSVIDYCTVEYAGGAGYNLYFNSASPTLRNSTIRESSQRGILLTTSNATIEDTTVTNVSTHGIEFQSGANSPILRRLNLSGIGAWGILSFTSTAGGGELTDSFVTNGIYFDAVSTMQITGDTFTNYNAFPTRIGAVLVEGFLTNNTFQGIVPGNSRIEVLGQTLTTSATWPNNGMLYIILGITSVYGTSSPVLTLSPGIELRFNAATQLIIGHSTTSTQIGGLMAQGTPTQPILFTSNEAVHTPGFWNGILFQNFALDTSLMDYCTVEYAGRATGNYNVGISGASPMIKHCIIRKSLTNGIVSTSNSGPRIEFNTITENNVGILTNTILTSLRIRHNNLFGNTTLDLDNDDTDTVTIARLNYWGGVTNPSSRFQGIVTYRPWLGAPFTEPFNAQQAIVSPLEFIPIENYTEFLAKLSEAANWTVEARDGVGTLVKSFSGSGDTLSPHWFGDDASGFALPNGTYTLTLNATSQSTAQPLSPVVDEVILTGTLPVAQIINPLQFSFIVPGTIPIQGTAAGTNFQSYTLDYGVGEAPLTFTTIVSGVTTPVTNGILASWNASTLIQPVYTIRLRVFDTSGTMIGMDTVTVNLLAISGVSDSVDPFSPDEDGVSDTSTFNATFSYSVNWTLTIKNSSDTVVRSFSGSGTSVVQVWDGKDDGEVLLPDGIYTYIFSGTEPGSGVTVQSASLTSTIDVTDPTAILTAPVENEIIQNDNDINFVGTADDLNFSQYTLAYGEGISPPSFTVFRTSTTRVVGGVLGTLSGVTLANLVNGTYTIRLTVNDRAGNRTILDRVIVLDRVVITNISASPDVFDPVQGEIGDLHYTLNMPAEVTIRIYAEEGRGLVRALISSAPRPAGATTETWDGRNGSGTVLSQGAYYFVITAAGPSGQSGDYNDPVNPVMGPAVPPSTNRSVDATSFDPYRNTLVAVRYTLSAHARIPVDIRTPSGQVIRTLVNNEVRPSGENAEYWAGRRNDGTFHTGDFNVLINLPSPLPANPFIIRQLPLLDPPSFKTEAYLILPLYGEVSTISYTLNREAVVNLEIQDPNGSHFKDLLGPPPVVQPVGSYSVEWDGKDGAGISPSVEGAYRVNFTAVGTAGGDTQQRTGTIMIYR